MSNVEFLKLFPKAFKEWIHDRADGLAASIAYYQLLSIPPLVALIVLASSAIFGQQRSKEEMEPLISSFFHPQFVIAIKYMLRYTFHLEESKFYTITVLAIISLIHGTFSYFEQIKDSIETFWDKRTEEANIKARIKKKAEALFMTVVSFLLLLFGFVAVHWFSGLENVLFFSIEFITEFVVFFSLIMFLLVYCPPVKINWKEAFPGVTITTILYMMGRLGLKYVLRNHESSSEDVTATLLLYLVWAYYSSLIFLYGAEFTKLYIKKKHQ
jgi:membrane protein